MRVRFTKEDLENRTKEDLENSVNFCIQAGLLPLGTTIDDVLIYEPPKLKLKPFVYMTSDIRDSLMSCIDSGDFLGLVMMLESLMKCVDIETMKQIQELVEKKKKSKRFF